MATKIAVLGTGANGSCIGADLVQAGHDVTLIDQWALHVETMRAGGVRIVMRDRELHVPVRACHLSDVCTFAQPFDVVLLAMKAYDTKWACELIEPHLAKDGLLIGLQNAMTADIIKDIIGASRTIGCVYELSSEMFTPGLVKRNVTPAQTWLGIGALDEAGAHHLTLAKQLLSHVGRVDIMPSIRSAKWTKLVVNAMCLAPCAIVGLTIFDAIQLPGMRDLVIEIGDEAMRAGRDLGYPVEPIFGLTAADLAGSNSPAEKLFDKLVSDIGPGRGRNTVLQDLLKGRASETDLINGLVVDVSLRHGRTAPANQRIVEASRRIESGRLKPGPENMVLVARQGP